jgi:hypothetical protein
MLLFEPMYTVGPFAGTRLGKRKFDLSLRVALLPRGREDDRAKKTTSAHSVHSCARKEVACGNQPCRSFSRRGRRRGLQTRMRRWDGSDLR